MFPYLNSVDLRPDVAAYEHGRVGSAICTGLNGFRAWW